MKLFMCSSSDVSAEMCLAVCSVSALRGNMRSVCLVDVFSSCQQWKERADLPGEWTFLRLKYVSLPPPPPPPFSSSSFSFQSSLCLLLFPSSYTCSQLLCLLLNFLVGVTMFCMERKFFKCFYAVLLCGSRYSENTIIQFCFVTF